MHDCCLAGASRSRVRNLHRFLVGFRPRRTRSVVAMIVGSNSAMATFTGVFRKRRARIVPCPCQLVLLTKQRHHLNSRFLKFLKTVFTEFIVISLLFQSLVR